MLLAQRMSRLGTETAFEMLAKARALEAQGRSIVHLEIGEPDFDTPTHIREAAKRALDEGFTHYGPAAGLPELRKMIAEKSGALRGIELAPEMVVVTPGAKPIMFFVILATAGEDDEVIYPNPGFPIYESVINFVGAKPVPLPLREEKGFSFDPEELVELITPRTKLIILNSPQNPTGGALSKHDLEVVAEAAKRHGVWVLADEVYNAMQYEGTFQSIAALPGMREQTIILDGFSKTYAMTGWRLGYGIMPPRLAEHITRLAINCNSCTSTFSQRACLAALDGPHDEVKAMVAAFRERRDVIVAGLNEIEGVSCLKPKGAFYVFPNIKGTGKSSAWLESYLLNEAGVACLSGTAFGKFGEGYLRLSYAASLEKIKQALANIDEALRKL
ncbi:MAG TPA: pyridoxal phosphate-dependent aminotransferase [bacterium]|nr:pyridoxal phosphate-dependent aminotransferase [bacterium]